MTREKSVIYPVVTVKLHGVKCRALIDTGAGSSYISAALINHLGEKHFRTEKRQIEMMFSTQEKRIRIFTLKVCSIHGNHVLSTEMTQVDREVLHTIPNPCYEKNQRTYEHLKSVVMIDR